MQRVPYLLIIGDKELESQTITVRTQKGDDRGSLTISEFSDYLKNEVESRN